MTPAEGTRRGFMLDKLRASGLPDARARNGDAGYVAPIIQILSVPSGCFLSMEQIEASKRGEPFVGIDQCTPLLLEHEPSAIETTAPVTIEADVEQAASGDVVTFPRRVAERPTDGDNAA